jgi:TPR repeat protein
MSFRTPLLALLFVGACGSATKSAPTPVPKSAVQARRVEERECRAPTSARDPQILAVDWSDGDKIDLADAMEKHLAIVRYDCDGVSVLRDCAAQGTYAYTTVSPTRATMRIEEIATLDATLPFAGPDMRRAVQRGDAIDVATIVVGQHATGTRGVARSSLAGSCEGATHFVRTATVGAFAVAGGPAGKTNAAAELLGLGPMAKSFTPLERTAGELNACYLAEFGGTSAAPIPKCKALVSLLLYSIREEPEPPPADAADAPSSPRIAERERFETVPIRNACKIGLRSATKGGACIKPDSSASFACDFTELEECKTQCEKGDAKSCWNVAAHLLDAKLNPVKGDPRPDAFPWLVKSCTQGYALACGNVGYALRNGVAVPKDAERGSTMMRDACTKGDPLSCLMVSRLELLGDGMKVDMHASRTHMERACALGLLRGCAEAARMVEEGQGGPRDVAGALRLYERACSDRDDASCKHAKRLAEREASLGGVGAKVVADDSRVEKGAAPWPSPCQSTLRFEEKTSTCIAPDPSKSFVCDAALFDECKAQCEHGSARSCWNAAVNRFGVWSRDVNGARDEAPAFLERACTGGHAPACAQLGAHLVPKERERGTALLEKACAAKDAPGCEILASYYSLGSNGITRDRLRAATFYEKACELGHKGACISGAGVLETSTEGVYRDPTRALRLLDAACTLSQDKSYCRKAARLRAD